MDRRKVQKSIADKEILTVEEAAEYLDVNRNTLLELIREEKIPASKLRFRWRMKKTDIDYYVRHGKNPVAVEQEKERRGRRPGRPPEGLRRRPLLPGRRSWTRRPWSAWGSSPGPGGPCLPPSS